MATLQALQALGQSAWLDYIDRPLLTGGLTRLIKLGVTGVTSNPTIFHQAIRGSDAYDGAMRACAGADGVAAIYDRLTIADVQRAADQLRAVHDRSAGFDGYVSLEVAPALAYDTERTIAAAQRLWRVVDRQNLMVKVPATRDGVLAIEQLIAQGVNVNATLLFSVSRYEEVARAFVRGLARCPHPERVASVASVFVSRIDTQVDRALEAVGTIEALALRGRIALANSKIIYQRFRELFPEARAGARGVQRPLWASTGTKNPAYSDVIYAEGLIGSHTITTLPQQTLEAFLDHGTAHATLEEDLTGAGRDLAAILRLGIPLDEICEALERDGVKKFADSYDATLAALRDKCHRLAGVTLS
ncbi:MAG: transaldolase [Pseudomonadota bacterium]|nr:MAG: transaldolase [Pseudomonadota bacterium]